MRKTLCASVLVLALCGSAFAGDINNPPIITPGNIPSPPVASQPPGDQASDSSVDAGVTPSADGIIHDVNADSITTAALSVLNSILALL